MRLGNILENERGKRALLIYGKKSNRIDYRFNY